MMRLLLAVGQPVSAHRLGSAQLENVERFVLKMFEKMGPSYQDLLDLYVLRTAYFIFLNTCCTFVFIYQLLAYPCFINANIL